MRFYFSKRHSEALREKRLKPYIPLRLRVAIRRVLNGNSEWGGFDNEENFTFQKTEEVLKTFYGEEKLLAYDTEGKLVPSDINNLILNGFPARVLDLIEAWCDCVHESIASRSEQELNSVFEIQDSPWRLVNKTIILVDSGYLHSEIVAKVQYLMRENSMAGALDEFGQAVSNLTGGQAKEAIINAHKSVESVMKTALGVSEHKTYGELLRLLIDSGLLPEYYEEFLAHFEKLALGSVKERNLPARGHGQGAELTPVPKALAEFAVHLAGTVNFFIIQRWIEARPKAEKEPPVPEDDIPF